MDASDFVIGRHAFWAGDFRASEERFEKASNSSLSGSPATSDQRVLHEVARAYLRVLSGTRASVMQEPLQVATRHLSGIVWRRGVAAFELRAYMTDLGYESTLRDRFASLCRTHTSSAKSEGKGLWLVPGPPLVAVHVGSLGLITAQGNWCQLPSDAGNVRSVFQKTLHQLDPYDQVDWKREGP